MKFLKIATCTLLIAGLGYFVTQTYKRSDIAKHIQKYHDPEKRGDGTAATERETLVWLKASLVPIATKYSHLKNDTKLADAKSGYIFSADKNKIVIKDTTRNSAIAAIESAATNATDINDEAYLLYTVIMTKIIDFINELRGKLTTSENEPFRNYFKNFNASVTLTSDESSIIEKLKSANEFFKNFLELLDNRLNTVKTIRAKTLANGIKEKFTQNQKELQDFAKNYFNLTLS